MNKIFSETLPSVCPKHGSCCYGYAYTSCRVSCLAGSGSADQRDRLACGPRDSHCLQYQKGFQSCAKPEMIKHGRVCEEFEVVLPAGIERMVSDKYDWIKVKFSGLAYDPWIKISLLVTLVALDIYQTDNLRKGKRSCSVFFPFHWIDCLSHQWHKVTIGLGNCLMPYSWQAITQRNCIDSWCSIVSPGYNTLILFFNSGFLGTNFYLKNEFPVTNFYLSNTILNLNLLPLRTEKKTTYSMYCVASCQNDLVICRKWHESWMEWLQIGVSMVPRTGSVCTNTNHGRHATEDLFQHPIRRLIVRSREVSQPRDW